MSELSKKVQDSIKILRMYKSDTPIELSYSGGKDSDVILALTKEAGIPYRAIYKNTPIDPPYTISHCRENGVEIIRPKENFFDIIKRKGFPTRRARFCCEVLKEYKILDNAIQGIRRCESTARTKRYKEPIACRMYNKTDHVNLFLPILEWSDKDVEDFIVAHKIKCHPLYYPNGRFDVSRRLGCLGCPMASDNGLSEFKQYPKLVKIWIKSAEQWWNTPRENPLSSQKKFNDLYGLFAHNIFFDNYASFYSASLPDFNGKRENWKQRLKDYFGIDL